MFHGPPSAPLAPGRKRPGKPYPGFGASSTYAQRRVYELSRDGVHGTAGLVGEIHGGIVNRDAPVTDAPFGERVRPHRPGRSNGYHRLRRSDRSVRSRCGSRR